MFPRLVGTLTSMILLTAIGNINRFRSLDELSAYFGLIHNCHDSGESKRVRRNTKRGNVSNIVALMSIRHDSSLLLAYKSAVRKIDNNKAIIKVAPKLLNKIRFVLKNNKPYQVNMD